MSTEGNKKSKTGSMIILSKRKSDKKGEKNIQEGIKWKQSKIDTFANETREVKESTLCTWMSEDYNQNDSK